MSTERPITIVTNDPLHVAEIYQEGLEQLEIAAQTVLVESTPALKALVSNDDLNVVGGIIDVSKPSGIRIAKDISVDPQMRNLRILYVTTHSPQELNALLPPNSKLLEKPFDNDDLLTFLKWLSKDERNQQP